MKQQEKMVFCTLFDSNYLDRGLALYHSMRKYIGNFKLYIFAFDSKCYEVLLHMQLKNTVLLQVKDILTDRLRKVQEERTRTEFCWTCTPFAIGHVLLIWNEKICTYIDADTYFFSDPADALQEIMDNGCSVGLVEHRFERDAQYGRQIFNVGKYCIQFNTFLNDKEGIRVLRDWEESCLNWCYFRYEDGKLGDQKYPDKWKQKYACVHENQNLGVGAAPWNLHQYQLCWNKSRGICMKYKGRYFPLVFYHFEGMKYLDNGSVYLNLWKPEVEGTGRKVRWIYGEYFKEIMSTRRLLSENYHITFEHMLVDSSIYLKEQYSLRQLCSEQGILEGCKRWFGHRKNNLISMDGLSGRRR